MKAHIDVDCRTPQPRLSMAAVTMHVSLILIDRRPPSAAGRGRGRWRGGGRAKGCASPTHLGLRLECMLFVVLSKRPQARLVAVPPLDARQERPPKRLLAEHAPPRARPLVNAPAQLREAGGVGHPQSAADEARARVAVHVVAGVGSLSARPREGGAVVGLVGRGVLGEAHVAVDAEDDVFDGQLGDGGVCGDDLGRERLDKTAPVLEGATVLRVVR